jgi:hypothetical protein
MVAIAISPRAIENVKTASPNNWNQTAQNSWISNPPTESRKQINILKDVKVIPWLIRT